MDIGTYVATSSGILQMKKLEVQNNNLANINTVGFKGQFVVAEPQSFDDTLASTIDEKDPYARADQERFKNVADVKTQIDFSQGPIQHTGNPLDVALRSPNDFFVVNTPKGELYTRAGNFSLSPAGELVTADGYQVMGEGGAITAAAPGVSIFPDGSIRAGANIGAQPNIVGRLRVVRFEDTKGLEAAEGARFRIKSGARPVQVDPRVEPQSLEMSNVSAVNGMVDLITTNRAFEAYTKAAQTLDSMNQAAVTQLGRRQR
jgi:flagellar basal-body rod protein FlgF